MTELAPAFERATGHKVVATFDSAGGLERRIKAGESFDVLLIGPDLVDPLIKQGAIEEKEIAWRGVQGTSYQGSWDSRHTLV